MFIDFIAHLGELLHLKESIFFHIEFIEVFPFIVSLLLTKNPA